MRERALVINRDASRLFLLACVGLGVFLMANVAIMVILWAAMDYAQRTAYETQRFANALERIGNIQESAVGLVTINVSFSLDGKQASLTVPQRPGMTADDQVAELEQRLQRIAKQK